MMSLIKREKRLAGKQDALNVKLTQLNITGNPSPTELKSMISNFITEESAALESKTKLFDAKVNAASHKLQDQVRSGVISEKKAIGALKQFGLDTTNKNDE